MVRLAVVFAFLSTVRAARIQVDTEAVELEQATEEGHHTNPRRTTLPDISGLVNCGSVLHPPGRWCRNVEDDPPSWKGPAEPAPNPFPNPATIINAESGRRLYAFGISSSESFDRGIGAADLENVLHGSRSYHIGGIDRWSIEPAADLENVFTINNLDAQILSQHRSLKLDGRPGIDAHQRLVEGYPTGMYTGGDGMESFPAEALWRIEPTDDGKYTITNVAFEVRLYANTQDSWENGFGSAWSGGPLWPDQKWSIEATD